FTLVHLVSNSAQGEVNAREPVASPACEMASQTFPMFISESFSNARLSSYHNFYSIRGAEVSFGCGVLASGKALVFNKDGRRQLITSFFDSSQSRFLQFTLRLGSRSVLSTCKAPDQPGEGVLLHYSYDNGITWKLLEHYPYLNYHEPRQFGIQFRWWQPYHSSQGEDVWAIDEIIMTSVLFNSISLDFTNLKNATNCKTQLCCSFFLSVVFLAGVELARKTLWTRYLASSMRYVETQSMQIGASYMIQFNLVMGCGQQYTPHMDNQVKLEYSTNHGLTWHLVQEECLPSMPSCQEFTPASIYHSSEYTKWRRITCYYTSQDEWALDNIYIGQQCDSGYQGTECHPENNLPSTIMSDFENPNTLEKEWQEVIGGEIVKPEQGCGVISSGSSLYFNKAGKRQLVSLDLDTTWVDFVQFYIQIGGESPSCNKPDSREEGVLLQYSNNGGINWHALAEMYFSDFSKSRFVYLELPPAAKTPCTRFRWWQPVFSGEGYDQWAIDDIIILMWLMLANEGMTKNETFCSATPSAMIFGKSDGDRFAVTRDLVLKPGYVLQFKYSHDAGLSWSLVKEGCFPASPGVKGCEGSTRELTAPTMYYAGDFEEWTRITIVVPRSLAARKTRFRWIQESHSQKSLPPFGLDGVYISEPCPNYCNGQGDCISGVCFCDMAYTASHGTCVSNVPNPSEMFDRFERKLSPLWYKITGAEVGNGCGILNDGKSLYFGLVVQYSNDNGISWTLLRELDFLSFLEPQIVSIELPREAKTSATAFRWWQPQHDKFDGSVDLQANWYRVQGGQVNIDCLSMDTSLIFSENIAEHGLQQTFQRCPRHSFSVLPEQRKRLALGDRRVCAAQNRLPTLHREFGPPEHASDGSSMIIPPVGTPGLLIMSSWPPDVPGCVPVMESVILGIDDFNGNLHPDLWPEVYGAERGNLNGDTIKSGTSLIFKGEGLRMLVSRDLDCTNTMYIQFSFRFLAKGTPERSHSILLQYSVNGGITWHLIDEFYFTQTTDVLFINIPLPYSARNSKKEEIWIIDNFIIDGNNLKNPVILSDTFDLGPKEDNWFFYPGGNIGLYCPYSSKGAPEEDSAMVFVSNEVGEHSITTRDLNVNENTIIQFEINIGCTTDSSSADPVKLEFSRDLGATWHLLLPLCYSSSSYLSSLCSVEHHPSSTYYAGTTQGWRREVIHFGKLHLCGSTGIGQVLTGEWWKTIQEMWNPVRRKQPLL
ncbi:hypothetical protein E2320_005871, partial [Naja naja]